MRHFFSTILILTFSSTLLAQEKEKEPDWNFKSKTAKSALKSYSGEIAKLNKQDEAELKKLEDEHKQRRKKRRLQLIMELEKALDEATKSGDLDDAIKIRDAIKVLKKGAEPPNISGPLEFGKSGDRPKYPTGVWRIMWPNGSERLYRFSGKKVKAEDSNASWKRTGSLTQKKSDLYLEFPSDDAIERLSMVGDRLFVEHWEPKSTYPKSDPKFVGRAVPAGKGRPIDRLVKTLARHPWFLNKEAEDRNRSAPNDRSGVLTILSNGKWTLADRFGGSWKKERNALVLTGRPQFVYTVTISNNVVRCVESHPSHPGGQKVFILRPATK